METLKAEMDKLEDELSILRDKRMAADKAYNNVSVDYTAANEANDAFWNNPTWNLICNKQFILEDEEGNQENFSMYNWYSLIDYIPNVDWNNFGWYSKQYAYNDYTTVMGDSLVAQATELSYDLRTTELAFNASMASRRFLTRYTVKPSGISNLSEPFFGMTHLVNPSLATSARR